MRQTYSHRGADVRVVYEGENGGLLSIQVGELEVAELPGVNQNVVIPTSCATAVGTKWLAKKDRDHRPAGIPRPGRANWPR